MGTAGQPQFVCPECQWLGDEPESHKSYGDRDAGESYWVVHLTCPECGYDQLIETRICTECEFREADDGYDECRECRSEEDQCVVEHAYDMGGEHGR